MSSINLSISGSNLNGILQAHCVKGTERMSSDFNYSILCHTLEAQIQKSDLLGKKICCIITDNVNRNEKIIHGVITAFSFVSVTTTSSKIYYNFELIVNSVLNILDYSIHSRTFQGKNIDQIVSEIGKNVSLKLKTGNLKKLPEYKKPYSIQYNESDFFYISRIMKQVGLFFFFTHNENNHTLFLTDTHNDYLEVPQFNERALTFTSRPKYKIGPNQISVSNYNFDEFRPVKTSVEQIKSFLKETIPVHLFQDTENQKFSPELDAKLIKETILATQNTLSCETTDITFRPGYYFKLKSGAGYVVTSAAFYAEDTTHLPHGSHFKTHTSFQCIDRLKEYRGEENFPSPKIYGTLTAKVVSDDGGSSVDADNYGRVFIKFPWDTSIDKTSIQVRTTQLWAGSNQGFQFTPHVGDEVLVSFINGDPEHPIVIGSLYNSNNDSNFSPKDKPHVQGLVTKSNNSLLFTDDEGKEHVQVDAKKDFSLNCNDKNTMNQKSLQIVAKKNISLSAIEEITIHGAGHNKLTMSANGNITVGSPTAFVHISPDGNMSLTSASPIQVTGGIVSDKPIVAPNIH